MVEFDWLTDLDGFNGVLSLLILVDHLLLRSTQLSQCLWKNKHKNKTAAFFFLKRKFSQSVAALADLFS